MAMAWSESHFAMQPWRPRSRAGAVAGVIHRKGPSPSHPQGYELVAPQMSLGDQSKRRYHGILTPRAHGQAFLAAGVAIQLANAAPRVPNSHVRASPSWVLIFLLSSWMEKRNRGWGNGKTDVCDAGLTGERCGLLLGTFKVYDTRPFTSPQHRTPSS